MGGKAHIPDIIKCKGHIIDKHPNRQALEVGARKAQHIHRLIQIYSVCGTLAGLECHHAHADLLIVQGHPQECFVDVVVDQLVIRQLVGAVACPCEILAYFLSVVVV